MGGIIMAWLENKVAVITGGAGGIGKVTAETFLREGAKVVLVDLVEEALDKAKAELESLGEVVTVVADVTKEEDVEKYVKAAVDRFGKIDVFFNNAGIVGKAAPIVEQDAAEFDKVMNVNTRGVFLGLKHVLKVMIEQKSGSIINTSSVAGLMAWEGIAPYVASKHAVAGLTKIAALEGAPYGVRVNSIHPAPVETMMMRQLESGYNPDDPETAKKGVEQLIPIGRYADPQDIANLVLFLASDESSFISGAQYRIDGGMAAK